jgi:hypothetical protein
VREFKSTEGHVVEVSFGKKPSALIPVVMSLVALVLFGIQLATHGVKLERAEGAVAHLYQLLVVGQLPFIAFFAFRWLRQAPLQGLPVFAVQVVALAAALIPVHMMGW